MRRLSQIAIIVFVAINFAEAQIPPSITYDSLSGDWIITYQGSQGPLEVYFVPATKIEPTVSCNVIETGDTLLYSYTLTNGTLSLQRLLNYRLSLRSQVLNASRPNTQWRSRYDNLVQGWYWGHTLVNADGGPSLDMGIPADSSVGGFSIQSFGLPAIVNCYFQGLTGTVTFVESPPKEVFDLLRPLRLFPANEVLRVTVGPANPPVPFVPLNFLDTIKSYINQSRTLGWITNQTTANKYTRLIDSARANLQANNRGVTKAKLDSVLVNVYADTGTTLSSEAYALLRFNTEYVMKKLREQDSTFAAANKSSSWDATATNNARHLAKSGNYLHEAFITGGELFYRRSADGGSIWDQTHLINTAVGDNSRPCITMTQNGSIHIVWQRKIAPSVYEVWHSYSQDNGENWSTPTILPGTGEVGVSGYQTEGTMPVIAEMSGNSTLVAVYCSNEGLRYRISEAGGKDWQIPDPDIISGKSNDRVRFPALTGGDSYLSLLYDYVDDDYSPYSRTFGVDGASWSEENSVAEGTDSYDGAFSSVAIDDNKNPIAAWSGIANTWTRSVIFRAGYSNNKWSNWFVSFGSGQLGPDWVNPSLTYYKRSEGQYAVAIVNHTSSNQIKLIRYVDNIVEPPTWEISTLSESGAWANITQENASSGNPFHCWTDQSTFPYEIVVGPLSGLSPTKLTRLSRVGVTQKRRAVVRHRILRATLSLEFEPMKIVTTSGDTTLVRFKPASLREKGINLLNMWDYLGSGTVSLPANARRLVLSKQFTQRGPSIAQRKFFLRALNTNGIPLGVLDTTSTSGTISVNIAPYAGKDVILRPQVELIGIIPSSVKIGVGDVFIVPDTQSKPVRQKKSK